MRRSLAAVLAAAVLVAVALSRSLSARSPYALVDLGTLGGTFSWAHAVNDRGQVVGRAAVATGQQHAFLWSDGAMRDLGTLPGGSFSEAYAINNRGQVVGFGTFDETACALADGCWHAFLWQDGTMTDLGGLDPRFQSYAYSIDDQGRIVGISSTGDYPSGLWRAVRWVNGAATDLGAVPGAANVYAFGVNDRGDIVGSWNDGPSATPLRWSGGQRIALPVLRGSTYGEAYKINALGTVAGVSDVEHHTHAVEWVNGVIDDLGVLPGGLFSVARDINDDGVVVGEDFSTSLGYRAFVRDAGEMMALPAVGQSYAEGINARGDVAGAVTTNGTFHAVVWRAP